jgi:protein-tyrosine sulfotransferase
MTLAHLLATSDNARIWHHPQPHLVDDTLFAYWGKIDKGKTFWRARGSLLNKTWAEGLIHGETDHNMTPFADVIAREIPGAKFVALVRDPRDFVRSGMRRNYYNGHPWDSGRLRPPAGTPELSSWEKMSQFEKICWLWAETYRKIEALASTIGRERVMTIRFEDLVTGTETARQIFHFLGLTGFDEFETSLVIKNKYNKQISGDFPKPEKWTLDQREMLHHHCGAVARQYHYDLIWDAPADDKKSTTDPIVLPIELAVGPEDEIENKRTQSWLEFLRVAHQSFKEEKFSPSTSGRDDSGTPFVDTDLGIRFFGLRKSICSGDENGPFSADNSNGLAESAESITADINARYLKSLQHMRYAYRKGDRFVELGAYLGYYALQAARRVGKEGLVLAVEMMPDNYRILYKNLQHNTLGTTIAMNVGVGAVSGITEAFVGGSQINGFREDVVRKYCKKVETVPIQSMTIDEILKSQQISSVDLMAVQLNGTELDVLKAIQNSWSQIQNLAVAANYDERGIYAPCAVADFLDERGYATEIIGRWVYAKRWPVVAGRRHSKRPSPVFIGGCGRSGTTLLRVMLDSHQHIAVGPESELIINSISLPVDELAFKFDMTRQKVLQIAEQSALLPDFVERFFYEYAQQQGKFRWAEKTPRNIRYIGYILHNFPNAFFIHVLRDGRDVACSLRTHPKYEKKGDQWVHSGVLNPIDQCITRWVRDVSAGLLWRSHPRYLEVRYEDLVQTPEMVLRRVLESIDEPWDHAVLRHYEVKTASRDASKFPQNQAANEPVKIQSLNRWKGELSEEEKRTIKTLAGDLLKQTGYARDDVW